MIPAKRERTADELPVPPDGLVASHLVLGPAECMFDMFVALLDPHAQPVQPDHLFQAGWRERRFASRALGWRRQVGHQVPGGEVGQRLWIGGGHDGPFRLVWPIRPGHDLQDPPVLRVAITKGSRDPLPLARLLGTHPAGLVRHLLQLVNWLNVRTQMLDRGPFVRTFAPIFLKRRFGRISMFLDVS